MPISKYVSYMQIHIPYTQTDMHISKYMQMYAWRFNSTCLFAVQLWGCTGYEHPKCGWQKAMLEKVLTVNLNRFTIRKTPSQNFDSGFSRWTDLFSWPLPRLGNSNVHIAKKKRSFLFHIRVELKWERCVIFQQSCSPHLVPPLWTHTRAADGNKSCLFSYCFSFGMALAAPLAYKGLNSQQRANAHRSLFLTHLLSSSDSAMHFLRF